MRVPDKHTLDLNSDIPLQRLKTVRSTLDYQCVLFDACCLMVDRFRQAGVLTW